MHPSETSCENVRPRDSTLVREGEGWGKNEQILRQGKQYVKWILPFLVKEKSILQKQQNFPWR